MKITIATVETKGPKLRPRARGLFKRTPAAKAKRARRSTLWRLFFDITGRAIELKPKPGLLYK